MLKAGHSALDELGLGQTVDLERMEKNEESMAEKAPEKRRQTRMRAICMVLAAFMLTGLAVVHRLSPPIDPLQQVLGVVPLIGKWFTYTMSFRGF